MIKIHKKIDMKNIKVAIVGRINPEKIPVKFLKFLLRFSDIYSNYTFNFYGECDNSYSAYFLEQIKKNVNLIYHGIVDPENISNIYLLNNILLHPSLTEAGATVVLEAMSYGLPVICRNTGGLPNAVGDFNYLCNNDMVFFEKLLLINDENYNSISNNNIKKILNYNNEKLLFSQLLNEIKLIYDYEKNDGIPNIIHYIFGLKKQTEEFQFVYYLSILSNILINNPVIIYFHYQFLPYGYWWEKCKKYLKLNFINTNNIFWGKKKIIKTAHKADKIRLDILLKYGGIYMDIDTITVKPYYELLKYDFVIGVQEKNFEGTNKILYCNAILFSKKNDKFLKKWIDEYEEHFNPTGWCEASVHLPFIVLDKMDPINKLRIKILEKTAFYYPSYNETEKIFEGEHQIPNDLIILHYWNTYSEKYYKDINNFDWCLKNNSMYSSIMKNLLNIYLTKYKKDMNFINLNEDGTLKNMINDKFLLSSSLKIYDISIITIYDKTVKLYENLLCSILNQDYLYYLNIEIIIIDNGTNSFFNEFHKNNIKQVLYEKNIDVKIIELNKELPISHIKNMGIQNASNNFITFLNFNETIYDDRLIYKCMIYEKKHAKILSNINNKFKNIKKIDNELIINMLNKNTINYMNMDFEYIFFDKRTIKLHFPTLNLTLNNEYECNLIFCILNVLNNNTVRIDSKNNSLKKNIIEKNNKYLLLNFKNLLNESLGHDNIELYDFTETKNKYLDKVNNFILEYYYSTDINYNDYIEYIYN